MTDTPEHLRKTPVVEVKFTAEADAGLVEGWASSFGPPPDAQGDIIERGAYTKSLARLQAAGHALPMLWSHRQGEPVGSWQELREDEFGLFVRGRINPGVERGREALALLKAKDLSGVSIGYRVPEGGRAAGPTRGTTLLKEIDLHEISLVAIPAQPKARVTLKSFTDLGDFTGFLRDAGLPRREAEFLARKSWGAIAETEHDPDQLERLAKRIDAATLRLKGLSHA